MKTETLDTKYGSLWYVALEYYIQGRTTAASISFKLGLKEVSSEVRRILDDPDFGRAVWEARREPAEAAVRKIKQNLLTYAGEMHNIALDPSDKRSQVAALKDLLDRGGTGAAKQIDIKTPSAYKAAVQDLMEEPVAPEPLPEEPTKPKVTE